jgi:hypothetical protein
MGVLVYWTWPGLSERNRKRMRRVAIVAAVIGMLVFLVRLGQVRLAAIGAVALAVVRWVAPLLLRLLPFLLPLLGKRAASRQAPPGAPPGTAPRHTSSMNHAEALEVLGLSEGASDDEVRAAYAELIKKVHPDRGGTTYLAARVNLARDLLLRGSK